MNWFQTIESIWNATRPYHGYGLTAFVVTVFATPAAAGLARRLGVMDMPDQALKPHARPTPYLGGVAICMGWSVALIAAMVHGVADWRQLLPILLAGAAISLLGLLDDARNLSPRIRLAFGAAVIGAAILLTGAGLQLADSVFQAFGIALPPLVARTLSFFAAVFIVLGACHSTNLIDGLDGLCSGVTGIILFGFFLLAGFLAAWEYSRDGDPVRLVLAISMFGAALGFLPFNFPPAQIFMGDAGSTLLGFNCGMMILLFAERGVFRWVLGALMIFALPVFDTALAMYRRWRAGRSVFAGDRSHFYDQLVQRGMSVPQAVLTSYLVTLIFGVIGLSVIGLRTWYAVAVYAGVCVLTAYLAWWTGLARVERDASAPRSN